MTQVDPLRRRDARRLVLVFLVAVAAWIPLELVRREILPMWVFGLYAALALAYVVVTLPAALRSIQRNRPAETGERYWTID